MPHYYVVPLVESSITVWHPRQRRLIRLRQPLGVDQSEAQTLILGHSGLALVATVDPLHDARVTKFAEHRDELMSGAARTALAQIAGDREVASGRRCGDAIADLLKTPPAAWNMRPLRPSRARTLLTPGYYVWLDPTERTPVYFESTAPRTHSKGWRDHFDAPDGPLHGRTLPEGSGGASWLAGSLVTIASNQARMTLTTNTGDSADVVAGAMPAITDSDDAYVSADLVSVITGGSNALILYGVDLPDVFVGGLEAGWWGHAGNVFGMWSYATSAAVATSGSTTFTAGTYRIWRSGSSVGLQRWTGSAWVDVLGPVTNTADQGDGCNAGFAAFAHAGSGVFTLDNFTLADDDYSFAPSVTITSVTPDELSDGLTGVVIAGENFSPSDNEVWLTTTPDPQGRPAIDSRGNPLAVTNGTSNALDVPAHEAGDLLIAIASHDTSGALAISGWTQLTNVANGTACRLGVWALLATGSGHTATLTGSNNDTVAQVFRIAKGHHAVTDVSTDIRVGTAATGSSSAPNPPSVGSLTATVPYLVLAIAGSDDDDDTPSYAPSGYTPELQQESASSTSSCLLQIASLQALGITSVDPGTFSLAATEEWVAQTVVIPGYAAVEQTVTDEDEDEIVITVDLGDLPAGSGYLHVKTADNVWSNAAAVTLVEDGGTVYEITPGGSISLTGLVEKDKTKLIGGGIVPSGIIVRSSGQIFFSSLTPASALAFTKVIQRAMTGSLPLAGSFSGVKTLLRSFSGSLLPTGSTQVDQQKALSGVVTPTSALQKSGTRSVAGSLSGAGSLDKRPAVMVEGVVDLSGENSSVRAALRDFAGTIEPEGGMVRVLDFSREFSGTVTPTGESTPSTVKVIEGVVVPVGSAAKRISTETEGSITPVGSFSTLQVLERVISGALGLAGGLVTFLGKTVAGVLPSNSTLAKQNTATAEGETTGSGSLSKSSGKTFISEVGFSGGVSFLNSVVRVFTGHLTPTSMLGRTIGKLTGGNLTSSGGLLSASTVSINTTGTINTSGALNRDKTQTFEGEVAPSGSFTTVKVLTRLMAGAVTMAGTVQIVLAKGLSGIVVLSGDLSKAASRWMVAFLEPTGSVAKEQSTRASGSIASTGDVDSARLSTQAFTGGISPSGSISRNAGLRPSGSVSPSSTLRKSTSKLLAGALVPTGLLRKLFERAYNGVVSSVSSLLTAIGLYEQPPSIDVEGEFSTQITVEGEFCSFVEVEGEYTPSIDIDGEYDV